MAVNNFPGKNNKSLFLAGRETWVAVSLQWAKILNSQNTSVLCGLPELGYMPYLSFQSLSLPVLLCFLVSFEGNLDKSVEILFTFHFRVACLAVSPLQNGRDYMVSAC